MSLNIRADVLKDIQRWAVMDKTSLQRREKTNSISMVPILGRKDIIK